MQTIQIGTEKQAVLAVAGDDLRIDWGYFYLAALKGGQLTRATIKGTDAEKVAPGDKFQHISILIWAKSRRTLLPAG